MTNQIDKAPAGATHRYEHGGVISWYREVDGKVFVWRDGSWHAASFMTIQKLMENCMLGRVIYLPVEQADPVSSGISGSEAAAGLKSFTVKATDTIDWSTAPAGATHHIGGNKLEFPWHRVGGPLRYWNGAIWVKRSAFHTLDEAVAKGFAVVARPEHLGWAPTLPVEHIKFNVHVMGSEEVKPVTVTNETVQLEQPVAVAGTGISIVEWAAKRRDDIERKAQEAADLALKVSTLLRENPGLFSANELADLHQLCDAELTKRDAAVCGGQKYIDAHWFERGELPPVGARLQWRPGSTGQWEHDSWIDVDVIAHAGDGDIVIKWDGEAGNNKQLISVSQETFRPIRTERDVLVDVLSKAGIGSYALIAADAILAAGFKRGEA
ncbi:hypothetical protein ST4_102 [Aeromonas phage ST4]|nr:hypothetical protein ST4_102 [Aeromonas phage ST4]